MKKILLLSFLIILTTCSKDSGVDDTPPPIVKYTLNVTASPTEGGLVNPQSGSYNPGERVTILASPNQYFRFDKWTGSWNGTENQVTITMDSNKNIIGNFVKLDLDLDGITDDIDQCENTPVNSALVSSTGCKIDLFYYAENGVTIKALEIAEVGMQDEFNGNTYTVVDKTQLKNMIDNGQDISYVVTSKITDMQGLFQMVGNDDEDYEYGDITHWDVSNVTNMIDMFAGAKYFNQDLSNWNVSNVTHMTYLFGSTSFNYDISNWDVSNVEDMRLMFHVSPFNKPIGNWDVSKVDNMQGMFAGNYSFNQDISNWDVSNVVNMKNMFLNATSFNQDLSSWDVSNVSDCDSFWNGSTSWELSKPVFTICSIGEPGIMISGTDESETSSTTEVETETTTTETETENTSTESTDTETTTTETETENTSTESTDTSSTSGSSGNSETTESTETSSTSTTEISYSIPSNFQLSSTHLAAETFYSILLQWNYNNDQNINSINIYRGDSASQLSLYKNITNSSTSQYQDTGVDIRKEYYYQISYVYSTQEYSRTEILNRQAYEPINSNNPPSNEVGGVHYANQYFSVDRFDSIKHKFTIHSEPSNNTPLYYQFYQGQINDNIGFYYGIQTLMSSTNNPNPRGKALIFSRWETNDSSNLSLADGGWSEVAGYEGDFISVRNAYEWTSGTYEIELKKDSTDVVGDWYSLKIKSFPNGNQVHAGSIRFESSSSASGIKSGGILWTEIYGNGSYPDWHVSVDDITINDNQKPNYIGTAYSSKFKDFSNIYTTNNCDIHFLMGPNVKNIRPAYTFNWCE